MVILMVLIALVRSLVFGRVKAPPAGQQGAGVDGRASGADSPKQGAASRKDRVAALLLLVNIVLGIGILLLSAAAAVIAAQGGKLPL